MTATLAQRFSLFHGKQAFLGYLHIDLAVIALAGLLFLAAAAANGVNFRAPSSSPSAGFKSAPGSLPASSGGAPAKQPLGTTMHVALEAIAQRYRVSAEALHPVFAAAQTAGRERNLDPLLLIAVIGIESGFNPFAQSPMGALGLMQVIPRFHHDKLPRDAGKQAFLDPVINVQVGARILQEAIRRQGGLMEGLQYYGGVVDDPEQAYANRVIAEKQRIEQVLRRKDGSVAGTEGKPIAPQTRISAISAFD